MRSASSHRTPVHRQAAVKRNLTSIVAMMVLLSGLLLPFASVQASAPSIQADLLARASMLPAAPSPGSVVVVGDFQTAFGCGGWDVNCGATQLQRNSAGIWGGVFEIPAGQWVFRIVARADIDRSLGEDGDANGNDIQFEAFEGTATYFSFNEFNGEISVGPFLPGLTAADDFGGQHQIVPGPNGDQRLLIQVQGSTNIYTFADGVQVDTRFVELGQPGVIDAEIDSSGAIQDVEVRIAASLQVFKQDGAGNPVLGSCFAVEDGNDLLGQACDSSDGNDGFTQIQFPAGIEPGSYDLVEVSTPDGAEAASDQSVDLFGGDASTVVAVGGGTGGDDGGDGGDTGDDGGDEQPVEEPTATEAVEETFTLAMYIADPDRNSVAGGCVQVENVGEACDDDFDGVVVFQDVANGDYTAQVTQAPDGYVPADPVTVTVAGEDAGWFVYVNAEVVLEYGTLYVNAVDADGNLVPGACWQIRPRPGTDGQPVDACDGDDGSLDGTTIFANVVAGGYAIDQTVTPDGYEQAGRRNVEVPANGEDSADIRTNLIAVEIPTEEPTATEAVEEPTEEVEEPTATSEAAEGEFSLSLYAIDENSNPLIGGCYAINGGSEACDDDQDSVVTFSDLANGSYTVTTTTPPEGYGASEPFDANVGGEDLALFVIHPEGEAQVETGTLYVNAVDGGGNLVPGACWEIRPRPNSTGEQAAACDGDDGSLDGVTIFVDAVTGAYAIDQTQTPDGYEQAGRRNVDVPAGGEGSIDITQPSPEPTATEEPQVLAAPVYVSVADNDGNSVAGACVVIAGNETLSACDNDATDGDGTDGVILFPDVPSGDYTVSIDALPPGFTGSDSAELQVPEGDASDLFVNLTAEQAVGSLFIGTQDFDGTPLAGACYSVAGGTPVCDNGDGDGNANDGEILIDGLAPGDLQVVQTEAPADYDPNTTAQNASIVADGTATLYFFNQATVPPIGDLAITTQDENGNVLGGACYSVDGNAEICDNGDRDSDASDGVIVIAQLAAPGSYNVAQSTAPDGYDLVTDAQTVDIAPGEVGSATFTNAETPPPTGRAYIVTRDANTQEDVGGACFVIEGPETLEVCDNDANDTDEDPGQIRVASLLAGDYLVTETTAPDGYQIADPQNMQVPVDEVGRATFDQVSTTGSLRVQVLDESENPVADTCITLNGGPEICDNGDGDSDPESGVILVEGLEPGTYTVSTASTPGGFDLASDDSTEIVAGSERRFTITLPALPTATATEEPSATSTATEEPTATETATATEEPTATETMTATATATEEPSATATETATEEPTATEEATATATTPTEPKPLPPTETPTEEPATPDIPTATPTDEPATPEPPTMTPTEEIPVGAIEINVTSTDESEIDAGCFTMTGPANAGPVCDNDPTDESDQIGQIIVSELPEGDYTVAQDSAATGFSPAGPSLAAVTGDSTTVVEVTNEAEAPATGTIVITIQSQASELLNGACVAFLDQDICDNGVGDNNPATGVIELIGVTAGDYIVSLSTTPDGYLPADPQNVTVPADGTGEVTFTLEEAPVETGDLSIQLQTAAGETPDPAEGCVSVSGGPSGEYFETVCDNEGLDQDPAVGVILLEDLEVGVYSVVQASPEATQSEGANGSVALARAQALAVNPANAVPKSINVLPNTVVIIIIIIIVVDEPGDLVVIKTDENSTLLGGACFTAVSGPDSTTVCDNDANDGNSTVGVIRFVSLPDGLYQVSESTTPPGFITADPQNVEMEGASEVLTFVNQPVPNPVGNILVLKQDGEGDPLAGACFDLRHPVSGDLIAGPVCDADTGENSDGDGNGEIEFFNIPPGNWRLTEISPPSSDWQPAPSQIVTVTVDETLNWPVVNTLIPGRVQIVKRDQQGNNLGGACFLLELQGGGSYTTEVCDNQAGDGNANQGVIRIVNVPPGEYLLTETVPPAGYVAGDPQTITVNPNATTFLTVTNAPYVPPAETGTLVIEKVGPDGQPLAGSCFAIYSGHTVIIPSTCDAADGANDGTVTIEDVPVGTWTLVETVRPSLEYQPAANRPVTITADQTTTIEVENVFRLGRVMVRKTNQQGHPLQGACFDLAPDGKGPVCTNVDGIAIFQDLQPGSYTLRETVVPPGYQKAPDRTGIVVQPGLTTTVNVINKKAPPPDNAGSLLLQKFFCISGTGSDYLVYIDSSDGDKNPLTKSAGCTRGDATFIIRPVAGGVNLTVNTGNDGDLRLLLAPGEYIIHEQGSTLEERFTIYTGQQTSVIALNFRVPPKPAPGKIVMYKYTCDPGYEGTWYYDFVNNCLETDQLTNNVTFRVQGAAIGVQVTGANGVNGQAVFANLPPGNYTITEDAPAGAVSVYIFCGPTLDSATIRSVNAPLALSIKAGETWYCGAFNVQDAVSDSRGAIRVEKWECAGQNLPANYDWERNCRPQTSSTTKFSLSFWDGTQYVPRGTAETDADGIINFSSLVPGTYQLKEIGSTWCHAESDDVNAKGDLIVRAGQRTTVWIYNCNPVKQGPNTGVGSTAAAVVNSAGIPNSLMLMGLGLPFLALGFAFLLRDRKRRAA